MKMIMCLHDVLVPKNQMILNDFRKENLKLMCCFVFESSKPKTRELSLAQGSELLSLILVTEFGSIYEGT